MKECSKCNKDLPEDRFSFRNKEKETRLKICKDCHRKYTAKHYENNKQDYNKRARQTCINIRKRNRHRAYEFLLAHKCVDCGESDPVVLVFDHVRGKKKDNVSRLVSKVVAWKKIEAEIAKCAVRCSNCHIKRHAKEWKTYRWLHSQ